MKQSLTTSDKKPSERLEFWQEIVCKKYVAASAETEVLDDEFAGSLTSGELGPLVLAELDAPLHFWSRKPCHVRNDDQDVFIASLIQRGGGELTQRGRSARLGPGDLVIYDSGATFDLCVESKNSAGENSEATSRVEARPSSRLSRAQDRPQQPAFADFRRPVDALSGHRSFPGRWSVDREKAVERDCRPPGLHLRSRTRHSARDASVSAARAGHAVRARESGRP